MEKKNQIKKEYQKIIEDAFFRGGIQESVLMGRNFIGELIDEKRDDEGLIKEIKSMRLNKDDVRFGLKPYEYNAYNQGLKDVIKIV